jgi:hypothetical protein
MTASSADSVMKLADADNNHRYFVVASDARIATPRPG